MSSVSLSDSPAVAWQCGGVGLSSRFLLGTAQYPSPDILLSSIRAAQAQVVTVSVRRQAPGGKHNPFWSLIRESGCHILPNTAGCFSAKEAILTAQLARDLFHTNWIKLEVIGDQHTLQPHPLALLDAAEALLQAGFEVFPYCTEDMVCAQRLVEMGCRILMPWASPIGSGQGIRNPHGLQCLRARFPDVTVIVDAGIGRPSHAVKAMEMGMDAVLLNTAVAQARCPVKMAGAFYHAIEAGRAAYEAGMMPERDMAVMSTPMADKPFWHQSGVGKSGEPAC